MTITAWEAAGLTEPEWIRHSLDIRIRLAAAPYLGGAWGYSAGSPAVLWDLPPDMRASGLVGASKVTNCSTLTVSLLTSIAPDKPWTVREYGDLQVFGDRLPETDTPIQAVVRMGLGARADEFEIGEWYLVQGVRRGAEDPKGFSGHAFLARVMDNGWLKILEATSRRDDNGRQIGPRYRITSSEALSDQYPYALHKARLNGP